MSQLGVALMTMREMGEPMPKILEAVADAGYEGVEFVDRMDHRMDVEAVDETAEALERTGLESIGVHVWLHELEEEMPALIDKYSKLDCDTFVVPYHPDSILRTEVRLERLVDRIRSVGERLDERGYDLLYHPNHWDMVPFFDGPVLGQLPSLRLTDRLDPALRRYDADGVRKSGVKPIDEFRRVENELTRWENRVLDRLFIRAGVQEDNSIGELMQNTPFGYIVTETDPDLVNFQLDTAFYLQQGYSPGEVFDHLGDRVKSIHAKDIDLDGYTPGSWPSFVDGGEGDLDYKEVADAARRNDIEWVLYENGHATDPVESIRKGMEQLRAAGLEGRAHRSTDREGADDPDTLKIPTKSRPVRQSEADR